MVKWDSTTQGLGWILLSLGLTFALFFYFTMEDVELVESSCTIQSISLEQPYTKEYNMDQVLKVEVSFDSSSVKTSKGYAEIDPKGCVNELTCTQRLGFQAGAKIPCVFTEETRKIVSVGDIDALNVHHSELQGWSLILFLCAVFGMCIPCCLVLGVTLLYVGITEKKLGLANKLRCDDTSFNDRRKQNDTPFESIVIMSTKSAEDKLN